MSDQQKQELLNAAAVGGEAGEYAFAPSELGLAELSGAFRDAFAGRYEARDTSAVDFVAPMPAIVPRFLCRYCQNWFPRSSLVTFGKDLERCEKCQERHNQALDVLAGNPPKECGMCNMTLDRLMEESPGGDKVRMRIIMLGDTYVLACGPCYDAFVQACKERYKGTAFAKARGL